MSSRTWAVPVEAIRGMTDTDGGIILAQLAAEGAMLRPDAIVEIDDGCFIATVTVARPGVPARIGLQRIKLAWMPRENAQPVEVAA